MPFTPFHFGSSTFIIAVCSFLDPIALFIGCIAPDIEGITSLFILPNQNLPLHGPLHSFLGAIIFGILSGLFSFTLMSTLKIRELNISFLHINFSFINAIGSGLLGSFSHIFLDAPLYPEMNLFYPFQGNFLYQIVPFSFPYLLCVVLGIIGTIIITIRIQSSTSR